MSKKAVYSNKGLQVYITGEDFETLLAHAQLSVPAYIGKNENEIGIVTVYVGMVVTRNLKRALALEQAAIDEARQKFPGADVKMVYKGK